MAQTHDAPGGFFAHTIRVKRGTPLLHRATSQEIEEPFRNSRPLVIRLWPTTTALVAGRWVSSDLTEEDALLRAISGRGDALPVVDDDGHLVEQFDRDF